MEKIGERPNLKLLPRISRLKIPAYLLAFDILVIPRLGDLPGDSPAKMFDMVEAKVTTATKSVVRQALANNKNPRLAALEIAVARVEKAAKKRKSAF